MRRARHEAVSALVAHGWPRDAAVRAAQCLGPAALRRLVTIDRMTSDRVASLTMTDIEGWAEADATEDGH